VGYSLAAPIGVAKPAHSEPKMKHVWILNHYAQEPGGPGGTRHFSLARHLPACGWKASIIAASTDHGSGRQRVGADERWKLVHHEGVPFLWLRTSDYSGNGARRVRNMLDYTRAALRRDNLSGLEPPDAIIGSSVHPLAAWAGRWLARRHNVPFLFEVRDLWPQTLIDMGRMNHRHPAAVALRALEKSLYRSAARIIVLLPGAADYIEPLGIDTGRIVWIPNGVDVERFPASPVADGGSQFTLMYFGAHGEANGLDNLLDAMKLVAESPKGRAIRLRLIGEGPLKAALIDKARRLSLTNVSFEEPVAKAAIPILAGQADAFVMCVRKLPGLYRYGFSMNKLFDYLAASRPTVICVEAPYNPIAEAGAGLTVSPDDPAALASAVIDLSRMPQERRIEMGMAGRAYLETNHDMKLLAKRLARELDECVKE
jgi:glycosyltransferase involved in cell wall biosynthesis